MTGTQEGLADAVARDADAVGSRRAGRTPEAASATRAAPSRLARKKGL